jgi:hypothetical protein
MNTNSSASPTDQSNRYSNPTNATEPNRQERYESGNPLPARLDVTKLITVAGLALVAAGGFVLQDVALRKACSDVLQDARLHTVCLDAGKTVSRGIADSWQRNGGPAALAGAFLR